MNVIIALILGVAAYAIIDRLCVHRERMKGCKCQCKGHDE